MRSGSGGKAEISLPFLSPSGLLSWRKDHSRAPTRGKMKRECVCRSDALCLDAEAFCVPVGIGAVSEDLGVPFPGAQKAERNIHVARRPVRHASQKPLLPCLRATVMYCEGSPSSTRVSSHTVGTFSRNSNPGWPM